MTRVVDWYFRVLRGFIAVCLAVMVVLVFGNVVLRYAFNSGITVSEELSRWLFVWLTFVGAVVALRDHAHLGMDSVVSRLPAWGKKACFLLAQVLMLYCVYLFFVGSWQQVGHQHRQHGAGHGPVVRLVLLQRRRVLLGHGARCCCCATSGRAYPGGSQNAT